MNNKLASWSTDEWELQDNHSWEINDKHNSSFTIINLVYINVILIGENTKISFYYSEFSYISKWILSWISEDNNREI